MHVNKRGLFKTFTDVLVESYNVKSAYSVFYYVSISK